jgi:hypothetical protein
MLRPDKGKQANIITSTKPEKGQEMQGEHNINVVTAKIANEGNA